MENSHSWYFQTQKRVIGNEPMSLIITLQNVSELAPISDYYYQVLVGDGGPRSRVLESGMVKSHHRSNGWEALVRLWLHSREKGSTKCLDGSTSVGGANIKSSVPSVTRKKPIRQKSGATTARAIRR